MREITLEELLEAGCHFGHQVNRQNPKANEFIFEARNNVNIINLENTHAGLLAAAEYIRTLAQKGGSIIVVGTKRQVRNIVKEEVERARREGATNIHFVTTRWIGGIITNFPEVSKNFKKLEEIEKILGGKDTGYTKREKVLMEREKEKLLSLYEGVRGITSIPDALFVIDTHHESTAVHEASRRNVSVVGVVDTNADPTVVDYAIPSNDDAVGAVKLLTSYIVDSWTEGQKTAGQEEKKEAEGEKKAEKKEKTEKKAVKAAVTDSDESTKKEKTEKKLNKSSKAPAKQ